MKVEILRGMSGSGKSTYAVAKGKGNPMVRIVSADHFMIDPQTGEYRFDPKRLTEVHGKCFKRFMISLLNPAEEHVLVDNTNLCVWEIAPYAQACLAYNVSFEVITFMPHDWQKVAARNVHGVSLLKCWQQYQTLLSEKLPVHWPQSIAFCS